MNFNEINFTKLFNILSEYTVKDFPDKNYHLNKAYSYSDDLITLNSLNSKNNNININIESFTNIEIYDYNKLIALKEYLTDYENDVDDNKKAWFKKQKKIIYHILNNSLNGKVVFLDSYLYKLVTYESRNDTLGRLYANSASIQFLSKEIRFFLFENIYQDFDLINSQFSIILSIATIFNIEIPNIKYYVENREKVLSDKMKHDSIDRETAKQRLIIALNADFNYGKTLGYFSDKVLEDMMKFRYLFILCIAKGNKQRKEKFFDAFMKREDTKEFLKNNKLTQIELMDKLSVKFLAIYCHTFETTLLKNFYSFLKEQIIQDEQAFFERISKLFDKEIAENLKLDSSQETILSFVPFFDGAYINIINSTTKVIDCVDNFNKKLERHYSYIKFEKKSLKVSFNKLDENILNNYLQIRFFLSECSEKELLKLFNFLDIELFFDDFDENLTFEEVAIEETKKTILNRKMFYKKLINTLNGKVTLKDIYEKIIYKK